ncbi:unnamed protein product [Boreogadus saida]
MVFTVISLALAEHKANMLPNMGSSHRNSTKTTPAIRWMKAPCAAGAATFRGIERAVFWGLFSHPPTPTGRERWGWREMDGRAPRHQGHQEALDRLLLLTKEAHRHCSCHGTCTPPPTALTPRWGRGHPPHVLCPPGSSMDWEWNIALLNELPRDQNP